jgi:hypothetical protein
MRVFLHFSKYKFSYMTKFSTSLSVLFFLLSYLVSAQVRPLPYIESFDSYTANQPLNANGGYIASGHVYVTAHGIVGNCAEFQMTDTASSLYDTITSPVIGPLTGHTVTSFYFRAVRFVGAVPTVYHMTASDRAVIYVGGAGGTGSFYFPQYTIDSSDQNSTINYIKVTVAAPSIVNGLTGRFKIITSNPGANNWRLEFDSLEVRDTLVTIIAPVLSSSVTEVTCRGLSTGAITITASGATPPYHYLWSPVGATTPTISGLSAGTYSVTVTDSVGATATLTDTVTQPSFALLLDSLSKRPVLCNGGNTGSVNVYASGGMLPYTYTWSSNASSQTDSADYLIAGNYTVTVTDAHGCYLSASAMITQPTALTMTVSSTPSSGSNGSATAIANGGTSPFHYVWSDNQTSPIATGLAAGLYFVTVTDFNQCTLLDTVYVPHPTGIGQLNLQDISIYPNPATDQVYINIDGMNTSSMLCTILDLSGRVVIMQPSLTYINISALSSGIYIMRLDRDGQSYMNRLLIQH